MDQTFYHSRWVFHPVLEYAENLGLNKQELLKHAGLQELDIRRMDIPIDFSHLNKILILLATQTDDPFIGFALGRNMNMFSSHQLDYLLRSCSDMYEALDNMERYNNHLCDFMLQKHRIDKEHLTLFLATDKKWLSAYPIGARIILDCALSFTLKLVEELSAGKLEPIYLVTSNAKYYSAVRKGEVIPFSSSALKFKENTECIVYPSKRNPIVLTRNSQVKNALENLLNSVPVITSMQNTWYNKIKWQLQLLLPAYELSLENIAEMNCISQRSIQLLLKKEGTNFRRILNEVKINFVIAELRARDKTIKALADDLGYASPAAFADFFKKETGHTLRQFKVALSQHEMSGRSNVLK